MPTYEYECPKCGHAFERFQSMTEDPVKTCPECKGRKVRRLLSGGAGVLFKGSGFYQTDYRSEGYKKAAKAESGKKDTPSKETSGKSAAPAKAAKE